MKVGDRVRITKDNTTDGSGARFVDRFGTVVVVKPEIRSSAAVQVDGDDKPYHAFPIAVLEKTK